MTEQEKLQELQHETRKMKIALEEIGKAVGEKNWEKINKKE